LSHMEESVKSVYMLNTFHHVELLRMVHCYVIVFLVTATTSVGIVAKECTSLYYTSFAGVSNNYFAQC